MAGVPEEELSELRPEGNEEQNFMKLEKVFWAEGTAHAKALSQAHSTRG